MIKQTLHNKIEVVRTAAASQDVLLPVNLANMLACYDRIAGVDLTTALTLMTFGFMSNANELLIESFVAPAAGSVMATQSRLFVNSEFIPFMRVTGGTTGDRLGFYIYGYIAEKP
jgi:hypothetical protein